MDPNTAPPSAAPMIDPGEEACLSEDKLPFSTSLSRHSWHPSVVTDDDVVKHFEQSVVTKVGQLLVSVDKSGEEGGLVPVVVGDGLVVVVLSVVGSAVGVPQVLVF